MKRGTWKRITWEDIQKSMTPQQLALFREHAVATFGTGEQLEDVLAHDHKRPKKESPHAHRKP
jgi:hypothetical protein